MKEVKRPSEEAIEAILGGAFVDDVVSTLSEGPYNWRGVERYKRIHSPRNKYGMTYDEWYNAATIGVPDGRKPRKMSSKLRAAWKRGEDPADTAAELS